jgi:hypothetical protein
MGKRSPFGAQAGDGVVGGAAPGAPAVGPEILEQASSAAGAAMKARQRAALHLLHGRAEHGGRRRIGQHDAAGSSAAMIASALWTMRRLWRAGARPCGSPSSGPAGARREPERKQPGRAHAGAHCAVVSFG